MQMYEEFGSMEELVKRANEIRPDGNYTVWEVEEEYLAKCSYPDGCWLLLLY